MHELRWRLDTTAEPARLLFTIEGDQMVSLIRLEAPDRLVMTEPDEEPAENFEDGDTLTFRLVAGTDAETPAVAEVPTHPDIYARLGLDISTPQAVVPAFIAAAEGYDGLTVYFLLDPAAREFAWRSVVMMVNLDPLMGGIADVQDRQSAMELLRDVLGRIGEETSRPGVPSSIVEPFPLLEAVFRYAAEIGARPVPLPANPTPVFPPQFRFLNDGRTIADVTVEGDGEPAVIHLLSSASGRWRVLGVTGVGVDGTYTWLMNEPRM